MAGCADADYSCCFRFGGEVSVEEIVRGIEIEVAAVYGGWHVEGRSGEKIIF